MKRMTNADKFKSLFGLYATELWSMPEKDFLKWLNSEAMNCSEIPNSSDTISRKQAIDYIKTQRGRPFIGITLEEAIIMMIEEVPSAEPKTPSNGSITCVKSEKMHVRTMGDLISREDVCEVVKNEMESWLEGDRCDYRNVVDAIMDLPSAGGCKCPCEYREPCDYCHYDGHLGMGCPAEEGLRDERLD